MKFTDNIGLPAVLCFENLDRLINGHIAAANFVCRSVSALLAGWVRPRKNTRW